MTIATAPATILPALVKAVRPFAFKGRRGPLALRDALVRHDGGSTSVTATDLEIACTIVACEPARGPERYLVDAASGVPVGDAHDPAEFPAVDRLDGSPGPQRYRRDHALKDRGGPCECDGAERSAGSGLDQYRPLRAGR